MLRTDYTNDILDSSKNTERVYNIKNASGEIVEENIRIEDITEYSQEGSKFGANDINATNQAVNNINIYVGEDKKLHFVNGEGADSVIPFSNGENPLIQQIPNPSAYYYGSSAHTFTSTYNYDIVMVISGSKSNNLSIKINNVEGTNFIRQSGTYCADSKIAFNVKAGDTITYAGDQDYSAFGIKFPNFTSFNYDILANDTNVKEITISKKYDYVLVALGAGGQECWCVEDRSRSLNVMTGGGGSYGTPVCIVKNPEIGETLTFASVKNQTTAKNWIVGINVK